MYVGLIATTTLHFALLGQGGGDVDGGRVEIAAFTATSPLAFFDGPLSMRSLALMPESPLGAVVLS